MKGWLQTFCLTALLAGRALANEVELVRQPSEAILKLQVLTVGHLL